MSTKQRGDLEIAMMKGSGSGHLTACNIPCNRIEVLPTIPGILEPWASWLRPFQALTSRCLSQVREIGIDGLAPRMVHITPSCMEHGLFLAPEE